ncbi:MAG TPA: FkbM family methyltransferase [Puia sp.]|nr:FkbM family methyltransferase [Puia sp.]
MTVFNIIGFIWNHPLASRNRGLAYKRFFSWQFGQKLFPRPVLYPLVENSVLLVEKGMAGATGNIYTGLQEFEDMAFILHVLREDDLFADIGANIGVYTILAAKNAGSKVVSIEPIPGTFEKLRRNAELNQLAGRVELLCYGVGDKHASLRFTKGYDTVNHVVGENETFDSNAVIEVPVRPLDELLAGRQPAFIKMDVEGFEWPALKGAERTLASPDLKGIIIELNGCGERYGHPDEDIHQLLLSYNFAPYLYEPFSRELTPVSTYGKVNTIYLRDIERVGRRLKEARKYKILGSEV